MSVRKAHNSGRNHLRNVVEYYQQIGQEKAQSVIDSITSSYAAEGQPLPNPAMVPGAFPHHSASQVDPVKALRFPLEFLLQELPAPQECRLFPSPWTAPGAHGLPFPPPFPGATGTPPTGGFPPPGGLPNMPPGAGNIPPPPGGFPANFPMPLPGGGFPPIPPMPGMSNSPIPSGPRGSEGYPMPPGGGPPPGMDEKW
ncbi:hypothetical protein N7494_009233 [Penicillium frequentans]|uniref:U1-C C2H2-type zinc finger domain-containing protein n=1 Tax=Penicillium frequentans TaxID=3151616 RepID=A0AAD6CS32_9EURO|nr:hypothetical protein N7494_009233 [Penicillium glabrum]